MNNEAKPSAFLERVLTVRGKEGFSKKISIYLKLLFIALAKFIQDDCFMKASGISYTAIVSLVPTLTVALAFVTITSGFNEKQSEIFDTITTFLQRNDIRIDITPYLETLREIINSATQIGTVGFVVLIFSATAILRTFETAFNQIWGIKKSRPFADKIIFFVFILLVGPLVFIIFFGFASKISDLVRASHLYSVASDSEQNIWISGERGTLLKLDQTGKKIATLSSLKIDFENMKCYSIQSKQFLKSCDKPNLHKEDFIKLRNKQNTIYALSQKGILLSSADNGKTWSLIDFIDGRFRDFSIINRDKIIIVLENGDVIKYTAGIGVEKIILRSAEQNLNATRVRFYDSKLGFILDSSGGVWISKDGGENFILRKITRFRLEDIAVCNVNTYIVVGERGTIFRTLDGGETWIDLTHKNITFTKIWHLKDGSLDYILVLNNFEQILVSKDLGETWEVSYTPTKTGSLLSMTPINPRFGFKALNPDDDLGIESREVQSQNIENLNGKFLGDILAVGEFSLVFILDITPEGLHWHRLSGGDSLFSPYSILNFTFPLVAIWIFFFMLYTLIPNSKVPIKSAMLGSLLTSIIFLAFLYAFAIYVRSFSRSTMIIYRALAAVPLFLLYIYCIALIILLGAEITAVLQNKEKFLSIENPFDQKEFTDKNQFFRTIELLAKVYLSQITKRKPLTLDVLEKELQVDNRDIVNITDKLISHGYILIGKEKEVVPCLLPQDVNLLDLYKITFQESLEIPEDCKTPLAEFLSTRFHILEENSKEVLGNLNFMQILEHLTLKR